MKPFGALQKVITAIDSAIAASDRYMEGMAKGERATWDSIVHCHLRQSKLNAQEKLANALAAIERQEIENKRQKAEKKAEKKGGWLG